MKDFICWYVLTGAILGIITATSPKVKNSFVNWCRCNNKPYSIWRIVIASIAAGLIWPVMLPSFWSKE